jgi:hypothetical protein
MGKIGRDRLPIGSRKVSQEVRHSRVVGEVSHLVRPTVAFGTSASVNPYFAPAMDGGFRTRSGRSRWAV